MSEDQRLNSLDGVLDGRKAYRSCLKVVKGSERAWEFRAAGNHLNHSKVPGAPVEVYSTDLERGPPMEVVVLGAPEGASSADLAGTAEEKLVGQAEALGMVERTVGVAAVVVGAVEMPAVCVGPAGGQAGPARVLADVLAELVPVASVEGLAG